MSSSRDRIFGIDFSGSKTPAKAIWITEAKSGANGLQVIDCQSAVDYFDLSPTSDRDTVYRELKSLINANPAAVFGLDFPFSLPEPVIDNKGSWCGHLENIQRRFDNKSVKKFRTNCVGRATAKPDESGYLRRETDWRYGGQCPYHHQIQFQTFFGQRDLLAPLISKDNARALPMQDTARNLPWLVEVYPAATLSMLGLYCQGYKNHSESRDRREQNIEGLRNLGVKINSSIAMHCRESDDALDSIIAAFGTYRAMQRNFPKDSSGPEIEGQIFA